jgi:hypothetical protein
MKKARYFAPIIAAGALCIGVLGAVAPAGASAQQVPVQAFNPIIGGVGFPPFVTVGGTCPSFFTDGTSAWSLDFVSGTGVFYGVENKNGDWGGGNAQGTAVLTDVGTPVYSGHAHLWFGGGNNAGGQSEQTFTVSFQGSGTAGNITIIGNGHLTTNNNGTLTSNFQKATVTCS